MHSTTDSGPTRRTRAWPRDQLQLVTFEVSQHGFAVDILAVNEICHMMELTRVPASPPAIAGIINLRGAIIPVLDLGTQLGGNPTRKDSQTRIIVAEVRDRVIGLIVDCVQEVLRISPSAVQRAQPTSCSIDSEFIAGVAQLENRALMLLDLERVLVEAAESCQAASSTAETRAVA